MRHVKGVACRLQALGCVLGGTCIGASRPSPAHAIVVRHHQLVSPFMPLRLQAAPLPDTYRFSYPTCGFAFILLCHRTAVPCMLLEIHRHIRGTTAPVPVGPVRPGQEARKPSAICCTSSQPSLPAVSCSLGHRRRYPGHPPSFVFLELRITVRDSRIDDGLSWMDPFENANDLAQAGPLGLR